MHLRVEGESTPDYLSQVGVQVESLMDRKFLEDLSESYKVHKRRRGLKEKNGKTVAVLERFVLSNRPG